VREEKEGKMAKFDAKEIAEDAVAVFKMIDEESDLPEWLEAKITKAADYMNSVKDYLTHHMQVNDAANPAQQAAIAIAKKKSGKYDKDGKKIKEGSQKDINNLALYIIDLRNMLGQAKLSKNPKAKSYIKLIQQDLKDAKNKMAKLRKKNESIDEAKFRVTFDIEDAKLGRYTTDVEADDTKDAEKKVAAKFVGGEKLITKGKTKKIKESVYEKNKGKTLYGKDLVNYFVKRFKYSTRDATAVANKLKDVGFKVPKVLPFDESVNEACWVGYKQVGMKKKGNKMVPNCVAEVYWENSLGESCGYTFELDKDISLREAEYQGRKVKLGKIMQGDAKKFKVYVKNPKGNVVKVNFGQGGDAKGGTMRIRKSNPKARKAFRARHNCDNPGPRHKARYWSCRKW